jgi:hypothetical protein
MPTSRRKPKLSNVTFYPLPVSAGESWRLFVHCPGTPVKYIGGFNTKADAEAWASGPESSAWVRANYRPKEQASE